MSALQIVALGLWVLLMVLVGTITVGFTLVFYAALVSFSAVVAVVLMVISRRKPGTHGPG
jgi:hypothetical protein